MKFVLLIVCVFCVNTSFGQRLSIAEIDKDNQSSYDLWLAGKMEESIKVSEKCLIDSKEISYSNGIIRACLNIATILNYRGDYRKSDYYLKMAEKENLSFQSKSFTDNIKAVEADRYMGLGLYTQAIERYKETLNSSDIQDATSSSNIANGFWALKFTDSAQFYDRKAYHILIKTKEKGAEEILAILCANIGIGYVHIGNKMDSARFYLNKGLLLGKKINHPEAIQAAKIGLGKLAIKERRIDSAIFYFQESLALAKGQKNAQEIKHSYLELISAYELKKYPEKYTEYLRSYQNFSDSIAKKNNLEFVVNSMVQENEEKLNQKKRRENLILIGGISLVGLTIALLAYLRFKKYKFRQIRIIEEQDKLLSSATETKTQYEMETLGVLVELAKAKDPAFFLKFNDFNPNFKEKVLEKYPDLNLNDVEFCSYLRMNFDTKEIAIYANMTVRAVEAKKYRIRKKMKIFPNESIHILMMDI